MLKRIIVYLVVLCFLPTISIAAQTEEHLTWTIKELSAQVSLTERDDGLPVYNPKTPVEGVALYAVDVTDVDGESVVRSRNVRDFLQEQTDGVLQFTDDPDQASILLFYEESYEYKDTYSMEVKVYSSVAGLRMISLIDESALAVGVSIKASPGMSISVPIAVNSYYEPMPILSEAWEMVGFIADLLGLCQSDRAVKIGSRTIWQDAQVVNLSESKIADISPLSYLERLEDLDLRSNNITDVSPLSGLTNLRYLFLNYNVISDISPLSSLENLEGLSLRGNRITDISSLSGLERLETLYLTDNQITDFTPLYTLTVLRILVIDAQSISDEEFNVLQDNLPKCEIRRE